MVKNSTANAGDARDADLISWVGKIHWKRERLSTAEFLPVESHGQRTTEGYSPWGAEAEMTEHHDQRCEALCRV